MSNKNAHIRFVGDGDAATSLVALSQELGIEDRVEWQGAVADTAPQFRAADVVVAPSRWEGMSLVFLEAMACGAALVASDVQGAEIVGDAGILVTAEDHEAIARALDALLDDEARREKLGTQARLRSEAYDVHQTTARNLAMWQLLTGSGGSDHD
jgi:glycosyltransferase involved in cell wall biosynthesis